MSPWPFIIGGGLLLYAVDKSFKSAADAALRPAQVLIDAANDARALLLNADIPTSPVAVRKGMTRIVILASGRAVHEAVKDVARVIPTEYPDVEAIYDRTRWIGIGDGEAAEGGATTLTFTKATGPKR